MPWDSVLPAAVVDGDGPHAKLPFASHAQPWTGMSWLGDGALHIKVKHGLRSAAPLD
ncbi:hypothetical protein BVI1335_1030010 [Burkholderia vietnamiensis]|nr:hypothetical protein BVI1335_1030010 [Burkholderia vietnamiensis]